MISQTAEYVTTFGKPFELVSSQLFESVTVYAVSSRTVQFFEFRNTMQLLRSKNEHAPGWEFLFEADTAEAEYYRQVQRYLERECTQ